MNDAHEEELFITVGDIKRLFAEHKKQLKKCALFCFIAVLLFFFVKEPLYKSTATFKQSTVQSEQGANLKNILQAVNSADGSRSAVSLMLSQKLGRPVVEKLGLQIDVREKGILSYLFLNFWGNLSADLRLKQTRSRNFVFRDVVYDEEAPIDLFLRGLTEDRFEVLDDKKKVIGFCSLGERFEHKKFSFTLVKAGKKLTSLRIRPWFDVWKTRLKRFRVEPLKRDKSILQLEYADSDRNLAAQFLNTMMDSYHDYLKTENDELAKAQLAYLDTRQAELTSSLDRVLDEQSDYMKKNLGKDGFVGLKEEIEMLAIPKQAYTSKLFDLEVEQKRLESEEVQASGESFDSLLDEKKQRYQEQLSQLEIEESSMRAAAPGQNELKQVEDEIAETHLFLEQLKKHEELSTDFSLLKDPKSLLRVWVEEIRNVRKHPALQPTPDFLKNKEMELTRYLTSHLQLLSDKKRAFEENLSLRFSFNKELQGINLTTAQNLYVSYQNQLDGIQSKVRQLLYLRDQIQAPDFELSSLGALLEDAVGRDMVQKAADIALQLRDHKNRSIKEILRLKESLETEKTFLIHHIDQTIELEKLRTKLVEERIGSLQKICLDLIKKEKKLIEEKLGEISLKMEDLPDKWKLENHLRFKKELSMGVIEGISKIVETKNLHYNLFYVDSKPIDAARIPRLLQPSNFFITLFSTVLLGACALFLFYLTRALSAGFPVSIESLKHCRFHTCGALSAFAGAPFKELGDSDLETLRKAASFIGEQKRENAPLLVSLVGGTSLDCVNNLSELLALEGKRVLLIQSAFNRPVTPEQIPGLWHYLENKIQSPPIQRKRFFDFLPTGGTSRHAVELLSRVSFKQLLDQLKTGYDLILIYSTAKPRDVEAHFFLKHADALIVMTSDEKMEELTPYKAWNSNKEKNALAFLCRCDT